MANTVPADLLICVFDISLFLHNANILPALLQHIIY